MAELPPTKRLNSNLLPKIAVDSNPGVAEKTAPASQEKGVRRLIQEVCLRSMHEVLLA